jgi:hypothetical protein
MEIPVQTERQLTPSNPSKLMETKEATTTRTCATCRHWNASATADTGECRRHPPQAISFKVGDAMKFETRFPATAGNDWCGEYEAK